MEIKRTFKIPVGNLTKEESEKLIKELINKYDYSYIRELERKELLKNRLDKLNKIYEQNND